MAFYIQKPSLIDSNITVYYAGAKRWSDNFNEKALYASKNAAKNLMENNDGRNGGWSKCTIVSE